MNIVGSPAQDNQKLHPTILVKPSLLLFAFAFLFFATALTLVPSLRFPTRGVLPAGGHTGTGGARGAGHNSQSKLIQLAHDDAVRLRGERGWRWRPWRAVPMR